MAKFNLSSPWFIYYREINALFEKDFGVRVVFNEEGPEVKLYVDDPEKAEALRELLPSEKEFGDVYLLITVVPSNEAKNNAVLFRKAFEGNEAVSFIHTTNNIFSSDLTYVVFKKEVVQYFTDDLSSINGVHSTLYQDIAKDVFDEHEGVFFCTSTLALNKK